MEEDIDYSKPLDLPSSKVDLLVKGRLNAIIEEASERHKYEAATNPDSIKALAVIRAFIKRRGRVCYGGTAMNAILPPEKQFYSEELDLPDYDFFTPDAESDIREIVADLTAAGFKDIYHKVGIHEGTKKVLVNFVPVADITILPPQLYSVYHSRAVMKDGIRYTDPDMLRAMMYLELSRPKGQVERWGKVFERLQLINAFFPIHKCRQTAIHPILIETTRYIYDFIIDRQRVLCSAPTTLYEQGVKGNAVLQIKRSGCVMFASPVAGEDAAELKRAIGGSIYLYKAIGDVPERYEIRHAGVAVATIVADTACHSYYQIPTSDGRIIFIGSLEFLVTLFLSLQVFTKAKTPCVRTLIDLSNKNYIAKKSQFPPLSILCKGYQIGFASLLRKKFDRIRKEQDEPVARKTRKKRGVK